MSGRSQHLPASLLYGWCTIPCNAAALKSQNPLPLKFVFVRRSRANSEKDGFGIGNRLPPGGGSTQAPHAISLADLDPLLQGVAAMQPQLSGSARASCLEGCRRHAAARVGPSVVANGGSSRSNHFST